MMRELSPHHTSCTDLNMIHAGGETFPHLVVLVWRGSVSDEDDESCSRLPFGSDQSFYPRATRLTANQNAPNVSVTLSVCDREWACPNTWYMRKCTAGEQLYR